MTEDEIQALRTAAATPVRANHADIASVADDLAAAFSADPVFQWFLRDDDRRSTARQTLFQMLLTATALPDGVVTRPVTGGAAQIWLPSEALGDGPFWQELRSLPALLGITGFSRFPRMLAMRKAMDAHHPMDRPHDYLWFIGARPEAQGYGVGSRLLASGLEQVDARRRHAFLESSNIANVPLYRRFGFEVMEAYNFGPGSPSIWPMWREARAK